MTSTWDGNFLLDEVCIFHVGKELHHISEVTMDFVCLFGIEDKEARKGTACSDLPDSPHSVFLEHNWPTLRVRHNRL